MSKYIIEIEDVPFSKVRFGDDVQNLNLYRANGFNALVFDKEGLDKLTPLDKALSSELEEAYHKGFEAGSHEATTLEYQQGLNDAWEVITKIAKMPDGERGKVFGDWRISNILNKYSASEIITILDKHESEQQKADAEIKVGDMVLNKFTGNVAIVTKPQANGDDDCMYLVFEDGSLGKHLKSDYCKIGRHFSQFEELIEAIKGEAMKGESQNNCSTCKYIHNILMCNTCHEFNKWEPKEGE